MKNKDWYKDLEVSLVAEIGRGEKTVGEILSWRKGTEIKLEDSELNRLNVYANGRLFGYGSVLKKEDGQMDLYIEKKLMEVDFLDDENNNDLR